MSPEDRNREIVLRIMELRVDHKDLDDSIHALSCSNYIDQVQLKRLKKRKLLIKDTIQKLESQLIPDVDA
tara:strand:- start:798 stop:1007 length:210 start_codon:yes stop_codon:yes gene_type:complete